MIRRVLLMPAVLIGLLFALSCAVAGQTGASVHGKVTEVIEAAGYTYVEIDTGTEKVWAAGPDTPIKPGDNIGFDTGMPMANFHSKSLQRDFPVIYFVDSYITAASAGSDAATAAHTQAQPDPVADPIVGIAKLKDGYTIAEIHNNKQSLKDKIVRVRGKVTKFSPAIMGKNWVHIMDSSSSYDLTMTTTGTAAVNDVVIIEGRLVLDRDFNYGYFYPLIIEEGAVTKE